MKRDINSMQLYMAIVAIPILLMLILTNCTSNNTKTVSENVQPTVLSTLPDTANNQIDTSIVHIDSAKILGNKFVAIYAANDTLYILNEKSDTILKVAELCPNFEFVDFNGDGLKDIRIHYITNVPAIQDLLLFDKLKMNFVLVDDFSNYPDPIR